jgi:Family of unknown function (DUF5681)
MGTVTIGRSPKGRWAKGQSGNPGGRPKGFTNLREECVRHASTALSALLRALDEGGSVSVSAAKVLLEYGYGRPAAVPEDRVAIASTREDENDLLAKLRRLAGETDGVSH